jgi:uncharacterized phage protein (TIGR02220 family)
MRDFAKVGTGFWHSPAISGLSDSDKLLALYLIACPHHNALGCYRLSNGYVADDLGWTTERVAKGFRNLSERGFATRCDTTSFVLVHKHLEHHPIENRNQVKHIALLIEQVPRAAAIISHLVNVLDAAIAASEGSTRLACEDILKPLLEPLRKGFETVRGEGEGEGDREREETMSDSPAANADVVALEPRRLRRTAGELLTFLNERTNHHYRETAVNLDPLIARLKEGVTPGEVKAVIARKIREWGSDDRMAKYLRPKTLFTATNFHNYLGEVPPLLEVDHGS